MSTETTDPTTLTAWVEENPDHPIAVQVQAAMARPFVANFVTNFSEGGSMMRGGTAASDEGAHTAEVERWTRHCIDGVPYLTYFVNQIGFEWAGPGHPVEVSEGGLGEPIQWVIHPAPEVVASTTVFAEFKAMCDYWLSSDKTDRYHTTRVVEVNG